MTPVVLVLDEVSRVAPFGVRLWDVASARIAEDGLQVSVYPSGRKELRKPGVQGKTGVYSFRALSGMGDLEIGNGDDAYWLANEGRATFTLEVNDPAARYIPFQLGVQLPHKRLLEIGNSPLDLHLTPDTKWIPAFSSAYRAFVGAGGVIRAQLKRADTGGAAAWALLEAKVAGTAAVFGLADDRGVVAVPIPYPEPANFGVGSPPGGARTALTQQTWAVQIRVLYSGLSADPNPDLSQVLRQTPVRVFQAETGSAEFVPDLLRFGQDLILRSRKTLGGTPIPELLVSAPGSLPF